MARGQAAWKVGMTVSVGAGLNSRPSRSRLQKLGPRGGTPQLPGPLLTANVRMSL